jgi:hypothetical protein
VVFIVLHECVCVCVCVCWCVLVCECTCVCTSRTLNRKKLTSPLVERLLDEENTNALLVRVLASACEGEAMWIEFFSLAHDLAWLEDRVFLQHSLENLHRMPASAVICLLEHWREQLHSTIDPTQLMVSLGTKANASLCVSLVHRLLQCAFVKYGRFL